MKAASGCAFAELHIVAVGESAQDLIMQPEQQRQCVDVLPLAPGKNAVRAKYVEGLRQGADIGESIRELGFEIRNNGGVRGRSCRFG
jgi:hypothetical protein